MRRLFLLLFILTLFSPLTRAQTCNLNATTANFATQIAAANPGQTLCLATGNYGTWSGVTKTSPGVTITAAAGATPTITIAFYQPSSPIAAWLILDNLTIPSAQFSGAVNHITVQNSTLTGSTLFYANSGATNNLCSSCPAMNNNVILFNNDLFNSTGDTGTGRFDAVLAGPTPAGVTLTNSTFVGGCDDGINFDTGGYGFTIGPGNVFHDMLQGSCGNHIDPIQFIGSSSPGPVITGNYFYNNTTGIAAYDGANNAQINNNVIVNAVQDGLLVAGLDSSSVVEHNTVIGGDGIICGQTHEGNNCTATFRNNITKNFSVGGGTSVGQVPVYFDYNLCTAGSCAFGSNSAGAHSLNGTPTYVGGSSPATYAGYALTSTSLGHLAGSDGKDIGTNVSANTGSQPAPPTGLTAAVQ